MELIQSNNLNDVILGLILGQYKNLETLHITVKNYYIETRITNYIDDDYSFRRIVCSGKMYVFSGSYHLSLVRKDMEKHFSDYEIIYTDGSI